MFLFLSGAPISYILSFLKWSHGSWIACCEVICFALCFPFAFQFRKFLLVYLQANQFFSWPDPVHRRAPQRRASPSPSFHLPVSTARLFPLLVCSHMWPHFATGASLQLQRLLLMVTRAHWFSVLACISRHMEVFLPATLTLSCVQVIFFFSDFVAVVSKARHDTF